LQRDLTLSKRYAANIKMRDDIWVIFNHYCNER